MPSEVRTLLMLQSSVDVNDVVRIEAEILECC